MKQHKGSTAHRHYTSPCCNPRLKSIQHSCSDRTDNQPLNHFSSHKSKNLKTRFPLTGCFYSLLDAKWQRQTGSGGTSLGKLLHSSAHRPNQRLAMLSAWCYCADQKLGCGEPLWNFDAIIWSVTRRFLCHRLATKLVASTAGDLATSKPALLVNQYWWLTSEEKETSCTSQATSLVYHW